MQRIIWIFQLFQLYICHSDALYAKFTTPAETLTPSWTKGHLEHRAVPSEMITCGYKNGDPEAMTTAESGRVCRISTQNGLWGICKSAGDPKCTVAGRCRDQHDCSDGCGKTENPKFRMTSCKKVEYCSFAYLIMDEGHKYTYVACGAVAATDTYFITPKVPPLTNPVTQTASKTKTSELSSDTTAATETSTNSSGSAPETTDETSNDNAAPSGSTTGAIVGGVVGGLAVICGTAIAAIYLLRRKRGQESKTTPETGQGTTEVPDQTAPDNGPRELAGSKPGDAQGKRQTAELQGTISPRRPAPVELP